MIPVALDLRDRLVVSVGGGSVATRRVSAFLAEGAVVTVIAPALSEELGLFAAEGAITRLPREYAGPSDLDGAWLVHTATADDAANAAVRQDAQTLRVWCVDATSSTPRVTQGGRVASATGWPPTWPTAGIRCSECGLVGKDTPAGWR